MGVSLTQWIGLVAVMVCNANHSRDAACYQGWTLVQHKCYKLFMALKSWDDAHTHCRRFKGGSLIMLTSQQSALKIMGDLGPLAHRTYWTGLKYKVNEWQWTDGNALTRADFNFSVVDQYKDRNGFCMGIENNMLVQVCCSNHVGFVCEAESILCRAWEEWVVTPRNHCVKFMNTSTMLTWPDARGTCKQHMSDLATFSNETEWQFIKKLVSLGSRDKIWLGLTYDNTTDKYYWIDGRVAASNQTSRTIPSNHIDGTLCGGLNEINSRSFVKWFDGNCNQRHYFICEKATCKSDGDLFVCRDGQCVDQGVVCDGQGDCQDSSDEDYSLCYQQQNTHQCLFSKTVETTLNINTKLLTTAESISNSLSFKTELQTTFSVDVIQSSIPKSVLSLQTSFGDGGRYLSSSIAATVIRDETFHTLSLSLNPLNLLTTHDNGLLNTMESYTSLLPTSSSSAIPVSSVSPSLPFYTSRFTLNRFSSISQNDNKISKGVISPTPSVVTQSMQYITGRSFTKHDPASLSLPPSILLLPSHQTQYDKNPVSLIDTTREELISTKTEVSVSTITTDFTIISNENFLSSTADVKTASGDVITASNDVTTSPASISVLNDDAFSTKNSTVLQCTKMPDVVSRKQCIHRYLPKVQGLSCNISSLAQSVFNRLNYTDTKNISEVDVLQLTLELMDLVLFNIEHDLSLDDNCMEHILTDFELLVDMTIRTLKTSAIEIHNKLIDFHVERVFLGKIRTYIFTNNDTVVSDLKLSTRRKHIGKELVLSIMLITTSDNSNLQLRRSKTGEIDRKNLFLLSRILSITGYLSARPVTLSLTYTLQHNCHRAEEQIGANKSAEIICGYIDKESGYWSDKGCFLLHTNASASTCHCNHTTNFAILMQVRDVKITAIDQTVLSIITYIGCSVSLLTQLITVTVFVCVGTLNSERVYVHRNLCFAIIASQVAFLSGIRAVENKVLCSIVAMILHYFYTAMFVWMLVEGMHLYSKVVRVFSTERSRVIYYCGFGWGVPLVLVTISATADWEGYGNGKSCWLSTKTGTIWAFVGPAIAIILVNIVILAMVVKVVMSSAKLERNGEFDHIRVGVKGAMFLLPLLGLTWLFGLLAVNEDMIVFQYLFAIFNSLQGFFIFLFHCAFNLEVRQALSKMRERRILQRGDFVSLSNGNSDGFQKTRHRHQSKPQRTYRKKRVSSVTSDQTTSWSPKHSSVSSRSSTQSTEVRETDDVVVQDLTLPEENFALQYI